MELVETLGDTQAVHLVEFDLTLWDTIRTRVEQFVRRVLDEESRDPTQDTLDEMIARIAPREKKEAS